MVKVVGVRFRSAGKIYYFDPAECEDRRRATHVIVETARGVEYGYCRDRHPGRLTDDKVVQPLKSVIRVATREDDKTGTAQ